MSSISEALSNHNLPTIRRYQRTVQKPNLRHIPGNTGLPILGNAHNLLFNFERYINNNYQKHGSVFKFKSIGTLGTEGVWLLGPEANRLVLQNEGKKFSNFLGWDVAFKGLFDNALLEQDFSHHKANRKILQAAFKKEAIQSHIEIMSPVLEHGISHWPTNKTHKTLIPLKELLLETGSKVFFGLESKKESTKLNKAFISIIYGIADPFKEKGLFFFPYAKGVEGRKIISDYIFENIPKRRENPGKDIFSQLCQMTDEHGTSLSDSDIRDQMLFVLFAAHDTTTSTLCSLLHAIANNQSWQSVLREEMNSFNCEQPDYDDLASMEKTSWTIKEALRMYPPLGVMPRYTIEDVEFGGYTIPANSQVMISALFSHYSKDYWSHPNYFDPLRFSPQRAEDKKDFFQYIPFGGGAHKCLGLHFAEVQGKIFLFHLLRNYRIESNSKDGQYRFRWVPLTFPSDGLPLKFKKL